LSKSGRNQRENNADEQCRFHVAHYNPPK
jgi:hypothetical protein